MPNILSLIKLKKEANLLDSRLYIVKAFMAVATAYFIASRNTILKLDTISVLFGLMMTLEPVTLTSIKSGFTQLYTSLIGAAATTLIIYFFHINTLTIALAVAFTLYVCLKINWREVSGFAIFTSIYMTQYVQKTPSGEPSVFLTFRLRMLALGFGVLIAVIYNLIFSNLYYRRMVYYRISYLLQSAMENLNKTMKGIERSDTAAVSSIKQNLPGTFNDIDWVFSLFNDIRKEYKFKLRISGFKEKDIERLQNVIMSIRGITHLNYDMVYILTEEEFNWSKLNNKKEIQYEFSSYISELEKIKCIFDKKVQDIECDKESTSCEKSELPEAEEHSARIAHDLKEISKNISNIKLETLNINSLRRCFVK